MATSVVALLVIYSNWYLSTSTGICKNVQGEEFKMQRSNSRRQSLTNLGFIRWRSSSTRNSKNGRSIKPELDVDNSALNSLSENGMYCKRQNVMICIL